MGYIYYQKVYLNKLNNKAKQMERALFGSSPIMLMERTEGKIVDPLSEIFVTIMEEVSAKDGYNKRDHMSLKIAKIIEILIAKNMQSIEIGIDILGTINNLAPFVGIFGMVWEVMETFGNIRTAQIDVSSMSAMATALFITAIGLFVVICASVSYNQIVHTIDVYQERLKTFADKLLIIIDKDIEEIDYVAENV